MLEKIGIVPHPPVIIPEIGRGDEQYIAQTQAGLVRFAQEIRALEPETLVWITPHGPVFQDGIAFYGVPDIQGNLGSYGAESIRFAYPNDLALAEAIIREADQEKINTVLFNAQLAQQYHFDIALDHGVQVPLYFMQQAGLGPGPIQDGKDPSVNRGKTTENQHPVQLVVIAYGLLPFAELYTFGLTIRRAIERLGRRAVLIASGDLSHRLKADAPAGYRPEGPQFDAEIQRITAEADVVGLLDISPNFAEQAGECGLRSMFIAWGAADGCRVSPQIYSYEGHFGVGYMVADLGLGEPDPTRKPLQQWQAKRREQISQQRSREDSLVRLARQSLEHYVLTQGQRISLPAADLSLADYPEQAGVFVSLKINGQLRGCIGTMMPTQPTLGQEVLENAISAGIRDPRFTPVQKNELDELVYSVDVLSTLEPVEHLAELDPKIYGIKVSSGALQGLLLPDLPGIETVEEQISIAREKAGIALGTPVKIERFTVQRYL